MSVPKTERINFSLMQCLVLERHKASFRMTRQIRMFGEMFVLLFLAIVLFACKSSKTTSKTITHADIMRMIEANEQEVDVLFALGPNKVIEINEEDEEIYVIVDEVPLFDGKLAEDEIRNYLVRILRYPAEALFQGITGRVIVGFIVVEDGSLANVKILKSVHPSLDAEALRVIKSLPPKWTPGKHEGKPVKVRYSFPVTFKL